MGVRVLYTPVKGPENMTLGPKNKLQMCVVLYTPVMGAENENGTGAPNSILEEGNILFSI